MTLTYLLAGNIASARAALARARRSLKGHQTAEEPEIRTHRNSPVNQLGRCGICSGYCNVNLHIPRDFSLTGDRDGVKGLKV